MKPTTDEMVDEEIERAVLGYRHEVKWFLAACESPIERLMAAHMLLSGHSASVSYPLNEWPPEDCYIAWQYDASDSYLQVIPQFIVHLEGATYRLDFALMCGKSRIAVECDGHDFHEKTKEQARRDKKRDRDLTEAGWTVLRFTGSEIWKNPRECIRQAFGIAWAKSGRRDE